MFESEEIYNVISCEFFVIQLGISSIFMLLIVYLLIVYLRGRETERDRVETCTDPRGPNRSNEAASTAAEDDLLGGDHYCLIQLQSCWWVVNNS